MDCPPGYEIAMGGGFDLTPNNDPSGGLVAVVIDSLASDADTWSVFADNRSLATDWSVTAFIICADTA